MSDKENPDQAEDYDKGSSTQKKDGHKLLEIVAPEKSIKILDLGCGTGYFSKVLADLVGPDGQVVGVDPDGKRIKLAKEKYAASNVVYLEGDIGKISDTDYDMVFSNYVLHWIKDIDLLLKQACQCLKKGGRFAFVTCCTTVIEKDPSNDSFSSLNEELLQRAQGMLFPIPEKDFKELSILNGFAVNHWEIIQNYWTFETLADFIKFYETHFGKAEKFKFESMNASEQVRIGPTEYIVAILTKE